MTNDHGNLVLLGGFIGPDAFGGSLPDALAIDLADEIAAGRA